MISIDPESLLRDRLADGIRVEALGEDSYQICMPFIFDDGDQISFYATRTSKEKWLLSDDGDVLQRACDAGLDLTSSSADSERLQSLIDFYGVAKEDGALDLPIAASELTEGLFTFTQTCLEATWLSKMKKAKQKLSSKPKFAARFDRIVKMAFDSANVTKNWHDTINDPRKLYPVDYRIEGRKKQLFLFGVTSELSCAQATISCMHHKALAGNVQSVAIYEDEGGLSRKYADRLNDVVDRRFPRVVEKKTISEFLSGIGL